MGLYAGGGSILLTSLKSGNVRFSRIARILVIVAPPFGVGARPHSDYSGATTCETAVFGGRQRRQCVLRGPGERGGGVPGRKGRAGKDGGLVRSRHEARRYDDDAGESPGALIDVLIRSPGASAPGLLLVVALVSADERGTPCTTTASWAGSWGCSGPIR